MRGHVHLAFDTQLPTFRAFSADCAWACKKSRSPSNEISREHDERLLKRDGRFATHFEVMQGEHLLALFNPGLNRLPAVVRLEPPRQMLRHRMSTEMNQGAVLQGFPSVEARK